MDPDSIPFASRYFMKLSDMPRLKVSVRGPLGLEHRPISNVRDWDQQWAPYFQDRGASRRECRDYELPQWPKLMSSRAGYPNSIFLLPIVVKEPVGIDNNEEDRTEEDLGYVNWSMIYQEMSPIRRPRLMGLILLPTGNEDGVYKRIGVFDSWTEYYADGYVSLKKILRGERLALNMESYQRYEGLNEYVITVL